MGLGGASAAGTPLGAPGSSQLEEPPGTRRDPKNPRERREKIIPLVPQALLCQVCVDPIDPTEVRFSLPKDLPNPFTPILGAGSFLLGAWGVGPAPPHHGSCFGVRGMSGAVSFPQGPGSPQVFLPCGRCRGRMRPRGPKGHVRWDGGSKQGGRLGAELVLFQLGKLRRGECFEPLSLSQTPQCG